MIAAIPLGVAGWEGILGLEPGHHAARHEKRSKSDPAGPARGYQDRGPDERCSYGTGAGERTRLPSCSGDGGSKRNVKKERHETAARGSVIGGAVEFGAKF